MHDSADDSNCRWRSWDGANCILSAYCFSLWNMAVKQKVKTCFLPKQCIKDAGTFPFCILVRGGLHADRKCIHWPNNSKLTAVFKRKSGLCRPSPYTGEYWSSESGLHLKLSQIQQKGFHWVVYISSFSSENPSCRSWQDLSESHSHCRVYNWVGTGSISLQYTDINFELLGLSIL